MRAVGLILALGLTALPGCSTKEKAPRVSIDSEGAAGLAMQTFDSNADGVLSAEECQASPGLASAFAMYDADASGSITPEELIKCLDHLGERGLPIAVEVAVLRGNRGIPKAEITLQPAEFLGEGVPVAQGVTNAEGIGRVHAFDYPFPEKLKDQGFMFPGIYDVKVWLPGQNKELDPMGAVLDNSAIAGRAIKIEVQPNGKAVIKLAK